MGTWGSSKWGASAWGVAIPTDGDAVSENPAFGGYRNRSRWSALDHMCGHR